MDGYDLLTLSCAIVSLGLFISAVILGRRAVVLARRVREIAREEAEAAVDRFDASFADADAALSDVAAFGVASWGAGGMSASELRDRAEEINRSGVSPHA